MNLFLMHIKEQQDKIITNTCFLGIKLNYIISLAMINTLT